MDYQAFWENQSFAVVGHSDVKRFPALTYGKLKQRGKEVYPVDPGAAEVDGDRAYPDLSSLPQKVDAVILDLPKQEAAAWVEQAATSGISNVWIHQRCDTPEAISSARHNDMNLFYGTCAVMYLSEGFSIHTIHGWINRRMGKY